MVYNYSCERKKFSVADWSDLMRRSNVKLKSAIWRPCHVIVTNPTIFSVYQFFLHYLPGLFIDLILFLLGQKLR